MKFPVCVAGTDAGFFIAPDRVTEYTRGAVHAPVEHSPEIIT